MSATDYTRKKFLDQFTGVASFSWPALYLSLHTADPTETGSHAFEISASGYARVALAGLMGAADTTGFAVNTSAITFPTALADWGTVTFFGVEDSATAGAGNMMWPGVPAAPRTIGSGQTFQIPIGRLRLRVT